MDWRCSGKTNNALVDNLKRGGIVNSPVIVAAMKRVDRKNYVREQYDMFAYQDSPQPIGCGATISAPHMHAYAAEYLHSHLKPTSKILDVGSGSGYLVALFYQIARGNEHASDSGVKGVGGVSEESRREIGKVVGIEHVKELTEWSIGNLKKDGFGKEVDDGRIVMITGDGRQGYPKESPYDVIHVGAASSDRNLKILLEQLAPGGRMFVPVGTTFGGQEIVLINKNLDGSVEKENLMGVRYVPLTDLEKQHRC